MIVYFGIEDGPVSINDKQTILMNRKDSPIIITKSIMRGTDSESLFESDFIINKINMLMIGYVVYTSRFCVWDIKREIVVPLSELPPYFNTGNKTMHRISDVIEKGSSLQFYGDGSFFRIKRVMYAEPDRIWVNLKTNEGLPISHVSYCSGYIDENGYTKRKKIAFYVTDEEKDFLRWVMKLVRTMNNTKDMYNVELTGRLIDALSIIKDEYADISYEEEQKADGAALSE